MTEGRKLVGFLVCYNRYPNGKAFNLYEGRNYIGRDASCDICIPDDNQLSGRHMSIMYRNVDNKFKFRDELGTWYGGQDDNIRFHLVYFHAHSTSFLNQNHI